jgi:hypothetical protein
MKIQPESAKIYIYIEIHLNEMNIFPETKILIVQYSNRQEMEKSPNKYKKIPRNPSFKASLTVSFTIN